MKKMGKKIAFRIELLYLCTNRETEAEEIISRMFIVLRDSYEDTIREAEEMLHDFDALFRNEDGDVMIQEPIKVVSVTHRANLGGDWVLEAALKDHGYQVGVVKHRTLNDIKLGED